MKTTQIQIEPGRLAGQRLGSVLVTMDYITLRFAKYPLIEGGQFTDSAVIDIDEGFQISRGADIFSVRKNDDLVGFRSAGCRLVQLISSYVVHANFLSSGEFEFGLDDNVVVRLLLNLQGFDSFALFYPER
jgi:hypothetical protein